MQHLQCLATLSFIHHFILLRLSTSNAGNALWIHTVQPQGYHLKNDYAAFVCPCHMCTYNFVDESGVKNSMELLCIHFCSFDDALSILV